MKPDPDLSELDAEARRKALAAIKKMRKRYAPKRGRRGHEGSKVPAHIRLEVSRAKARQAKLSRRRNR